MPNPPSKDNFIGKIRELDSLEQWATDEVRSLNVRLQAISGIRKTAKENRWTVIKQMLEAYPDEIGKRERNDPKNKPTSN